MTFVRTRQGIPKGMPHTGRPSNEAYKLADRDPDIRQCQWIERHGKALTFACSEPVRSGSAYCARHHAITHRKATDIEVFIKEVMRIVRKGGL